MLFAKKTQPKNLYLPANHQITVSVFWFIHKSVPQEGKVPQGFAVSVVFVQ